MMASAIQTYVNRYAVKPGQRAVLFANNNGIYAVARYLAAAGVNLVAIVDSRSQVENLPDDLQDIKRLNHHVIEQCHGRRRVHGVTVKSLENGQTLKLNCDLVGISGGWNPTVHLYSQSRSLLEYDAELATFVPGKALQACQCIGSAAGIFNLETLLQDVARKTDGALTAIGKTIDPSAALPSVAAEQDYHIEALWHVDVDTDLATKCFIDIQNDVTLADVHLAMREGFDTVEHVKRYTTAGMGIDQGKTGNLNVIGAIALKSGCELDEIGTTTFRSPYVPIEFG
jgi:sarcosine oxidase subunit alpha